MNDPIFDALHAELDAAEARMDAAGVPKLLRLRCYLCHGEGWVGSAQCVVCAGRGHVVTEERAL